MFGANGSGFLHDEIVNAMGGICNDMSISRYKSNESRRKCFAMSSFFFEKVSGQACLFFCERNFVLSVNIFLSLRPRKKVLQLL